MKKEKKKEKGDMIGPGRPLPHFTLIYISTINDGRTNKRQPDDEEKKHG